MKGASKGPSLLARVGTSCRCQVGYVPTNRDAYLLAPPKNSSANSYPHTSTESPSSTFGPSTNHSAGRCSDVAARLHLLALRNDVSFEVSLRHLALGLAHAAFASGPCAFRGRAAVSDRWPGLPIRTLAAAGSWLHLVLVIGYVTGPCADALADNPRHERRR